jgi:hypothetical protein
MGIIYVRIFSVSVFTYNVGLGRADHRSKKPYQIYKKKLIVPEANSEMEQTAEEAIKGTP